MGAHYSSAAPGVNAILAGFRRFAAQIYARLRLIRDHRTILGSTARSASFSAGFSGWVV